jgi:hypothetical protein
MLRAEHRLGGRSLVSRVRRRALAENALAGRARSWARASGETATPFAIGLLASDSQSLAWLRRTSFNVSPIVLPLTAILRAAVR